MNFQLNLVQIYSELGNVITMMEPSTIYLDFSYKYKGLKADPQMYLNIG